MKRRELLGAAPGAILAALVAGQQSSAAVRSPKAHARFSKHVSPLQLTTTRSNPELVASIYRSGSAPGSRDLQGSDLPYVFAFYDEAAKKFVNPLDITPTSAPGAYTVTSTLQAFNIKKSLRSQFATLQNNVQLGFNATAPVDKLDELSWVFLNAVNIFGAGNTNAQDSALTKFTSGASDGTPLQANPKITVAKGIVSLQVTAFGQRQRGLWQKLFDFLSSAVKSPIISAASKGFAIPGLAAEAVEFVGHAIDAYTQQEHLVPLWHTGSLQFAIHSGAHGRFKMNPGLWVTVDSDYAQSSRFLSGHTIDETYTTFRILDDRGGPIDANYLVADLSFDAA